MTRVSPSRGQFGTTEVTEIAFGEQPAALFEAPEGVAHMTSEAYGAYLCTRDSGLRMKSGSGRGNVLTPEAEATPPRPARRPPCVPTRATARPHATRASRPVRWRGPRRV